MKVREFRMPQHFIRHTASLLVCGLMLAGCSQDYVSFDDNYVPVTAEERYPIRVLDEPVKMKLVASGPQLSEEQIIEVTGFAREAQASNAGSIAIVYASGNRNGAKAAAQAADLIARQGFQKALITTSAYEGQTANLTFSFYRKVARIKPCGDWSENLAGNQYNEALSELWLRHSEQLRCNGGEPRRLRATTYRNSCTRWIPRCNTEEV